MSKIQQINEKDFQKEVLDAEGAVLVDFSATWCGPCKTQMPILEKFAEGNTNVKVVKVDIDESPAIAATYGVRSIPSLLLFEKGQRLTTKVGLTNLDALNGLLKFSSQK